MPRHVSIGLAGLAAALLFITACGIPQLNTSLPAAISLYQEADEIYFNIATTDLEKTQGIVILYKIYASQADYSAERPILTSFANGDQAFDAMTGNYNYSVAVRSGSNGFPILTLSEHSIFSDAVLLTGFSSISTGNALYIQKTANNFHLRVKDSGTEIWSAEILRTLDSSIRVGFDLVRDNDSDVEQNIDATNQSEVFISFAVFGYRSVFAEGQVYAMPAMLGSGNLPSVPVYQ